MRGNEKGNIPPYGYETWEDYAYAYNRRDFRWKEPDPPPGFAEREQRRLARLAAADIKDGTERARRFGASEC